MTPAKHVLSEAEGAQSAPSSEKKKTFFFAFLASWREKIFLKWFCETFQQTDNVSKNIYKNLSQGRHPRMLLSGVQSEHSRDSR